MARGRPLASTATSSKTPCSTSSGAQPGASARPCTQTVSELLPTGPQTTLVLSYEHEGKPRERMIPFVSAYVDKVDLAGRRITVDWQPDY